MNQSTQKRPANRTYRRAGGGGFFFFLAIVISIIGSIYIFVPEIPRQLFGTASTPADKGPEPTAPQSAKTTLADKDNEAGQDTNKPELATASKPSVETKIEPKKIKTNTADDPRAVELLNKAQAYYTAMEWTKASAEAKKIAALSVSAGTGILAQDIVTGSAALEKLFRDLNDKDELSRGFDTHPSLVLLKTANATSMAVPIAAIDNPTPVENNPMDYIAAQRKSGKVAFLVKGKKDYIPSILPDSAIGEVIAPDFAAIIQEKQSEFESRLNRLRNSILANDPLAWYDAGKFAYRNRIDNYVTEMLNEAVVLEPNLISRVREDKAAGYYANMVNHMKNGNKRQAEVFMAIIARNFADTEQGKQARLYYDGKTADVLKAAKAEQDNRRELERQRRAAQLARAKKLDDQEAIARIEKAPSQEEEQDKALIASAATGDEGKADAFFNKGRDLYNKALEAGNTPARDELYEKAYKELHEARAIYAALVDKNPANEALGVKLLECNKLHYGAIKQRRFH
jgi:hypothetical protein